MTQSSSAASPNTATGSPRSCAAPPTKDSSGRICPKGWPHELVYQTVALLARDYGQLEPGPAADLAVDLLLNGIGQRSETPKTA